MKLILVLISGTLFGLGLSVSQMINPTVVLNFLDVAGTWNPALMFVMAGALLVTTIGFHFALRRKKPTHEETFHVPVNNDIDMNLIIGASIFGIGWGLVGYCPGPAIAGLVLGQEETIYFVVAMLVGIKCSQLLKKT